MSGLDTSDLGELGPEEGGDSRCQMLRTQFNRIMDAISVLPDQLDLNTRPGADARKRTELFTEHVRSRPWRTHDDHISRHALVVLPFRTRWSRSAHRSSSVSVSNQASAACLALSRIAPSRAPSSEIVVMAFSMPARSPEIGRA